MGQALSLSPSALHAAYGAEAGRDDAAVDAVGRENMENAADADGVEDAAAGQGAAVVADRNCACWEGQEIAAAGQWDSVGSGRRADAAEDSCSASVGVPPDCRGEHSGEGPAEDSSRAAAGAGAAAEAAVAAVGGGGGGAVGQHCGMDRCWVGEEGPRKEKGGTWTWSERMKMGQPVEREEEAEEGGVNVGDGPCFWHAMWP